MSKEEQKAALKKKRQAETAAVDRAREFEADATISASDLTIPQLRQVLISKGVPQTELKQLKTKAQWVKRVNEVVGAAQRTTNALDSRSADKKSLEAKSVFSRLGTQVLTVITQMLGQSSIAAFACSSRFLRVRLTLALHGTPSPALAAIRHCSCLLETPKLLAELVARASKLSSLFLSIDQQRGKKVTVSVPGSKVALVDLKELKPLAGSSLHTLRLFLTFDAYLPFASLPMLLSLCITGKETESFKWRYDHITGKSVQQRHVSYPNVFIVDFLECVPAIESLSLTSLCLTSAEITPSLAALPKLQHLVLRSVESRQIEGSKLSALQSLEFFSRNPISFETPSATLTFLCCSASAFDAEDFVDFASLRHLRLVHTERDPFAKAILKQVSQIKQLESLTLQGLNLTPTVLSQVFRWLDQRELPSLTTMTVNAARNSLPSQLEEMKHACARFCEQNPEVKLVVTVVVAGDVTHNVCG